MVGLVAAKAVLDKLVVSVPDDSLADEVVDDDPTQQCSQFGFVTHWKNLSNQSTP